MRVIREDLWEYVRIYPSVKSRALVSQPLSELGERRWGGVAFCAESSVLLGSSFIEYDFNKLLLLSTALIARMSLIYLFVVLKTWQGLWLLTHNLLIRRAPCGYNIRKQDSRDVDSPAGMIRREFLRGNHSQEGNWSQKLNVQTMFCPNGQHQVKTVARPWQLVAERSGEWKQELMHEAGEIKKFKQILKTVGLSFLWVELQLSCQNSLKTLGKAGQFLLSYLPFI